MAATSPSTRAGPDPTRRNLNFTAGQTIPNAVIAPVSATGDVCFYVYGTAHLIADVSGYFPTGSGFSASPARVFDTRIGGQGRRRRRHRRPAAVNVFGQGRPARPPASARSR